MNDYAQVIILGLVQGIAEFLPISSSGHLVLTKHVLSWWTGREVLSPGKDLEVLLHLGTLVAILVVYARDLRRQMLQARQWGLLLVASLPAAVAGLTLEEWFDRVFDAPVLAGYGLLVTATLLSAAHHCREGRCELHQLSWLQAAVIGCFQAVALVPGISRSGSTIAGGLLTGVDRVAATQFSFLMAIPITAGAILLSLKHIAVGGLTVSAGPAAVGVIVSFLAGWLSLKALIRVMTQRRLPWFAGYCAVLGLVTIAVCRLVPELPVPPERPAVVRAAE
uniref:Undecaprenyl-diphosphatase n=1 Tax=Schlesneria paludicola TaxID=360056 RepID=A0A7C4LL13_9PLAN